MITEIVEIALKEGMVEDFIAGVEKSRPLFEGSPGFLALEVHRAIERPATIILLIQWESVAHHMELFRKSPQYIEWRANVGDYFAEVPRLLHTQTVISY